MASPIVQHSIFYRLLQYTTYVLLLAVAYYQTGCSDPVVEPDASLTYYDAADYDGDRLATDWFDVMNDCVRLTPGFTDPVAARAYGYAGITFYESVVYGFPDNKSLVGQINGLTSVPRPDTTNKRFQWSVVANAAMAELLRGLFANAPSAVKKKIDSLEKKNLDERRALVFEDAMVDRSVEYGKKFGAAMLEFAKDDGGDNADKNLFPTDYKLPDTKGTWVPTPPDNKTTPMLPTWGNNRPFVLTTNNPLDGIDPGAFPDFSTDKNSAFYQAANAVYTKVKSVKQDKRFVINYWKDTEGETATQAGHIISIVNQLLRTNKFRLDFTAKLYAQLGIAMNDGCIACWSAKYKYPLMRPITYIQQNIDKSWNNTTITDPMITPPTPEYISGQTLQAIACFDIIRNAFGEAYFFVDRTYVPKGIPEREYSTFSKVTAEIISAQEYSGIHYKFSIDAAQTMGHAIATSINTKIKFENPQAQ